MKPFSRGLKRIVDFCLATLGLVIFFIPACIFALAIKLEDHGPLFYVQERWGKNGRRFKAYKFRTMVPDADQKWGSISAHEDDARITKVGRLLRATAMDELLQLINIWKGDMSFVGPRPIATWELDPSFPNFSERHRISPGLTGPAQIFASRDASLEEKFRYDLNYVRNRTFWLDIKLIFLSVWITLFGRWESRQKKI